MRNPFRQVTGVYHHYTETLDEVHEYLRNILCSNDVEVLEWGADLRVGSNFVEVKACQEFIKDKCSNGGRRRGRYHFQHPIQSDYVLFLLLKEDGAILKRLINTRYVVKGIMKNNPYCVVKQSEIFL